MPTNDTDHVVLILRHFTVGGLERVLLAHVRLLLEADRRVTVCVLDPGRDNALIAELPSQARLIMAPRARLPRLALIAALVRGATVLLEFGDGRLYPSIRPTLLTARTVIRFCHSDYAHLRTPAKNRLDRLLAHGEHRIVAVGGRSSRFLLDDVGVPAAKVTTLTNAIEPLIGTVARPQWPWAEQPYLVAVQSLYPHKGHDALLRGFARVRSRTSTPAKLVIIGDGDQTIALRLLADQLGIADHIVWLGAIWQQDVVNTVLAGARGFVSMSRFEGVPISVLEARRHNLPLILTDIPGHRDGAGTAPTTFVPVDDIDAFADEATALLSKATAEPTAPACDQQLRDDWDRYRHGFLALIGEPSDLETAEAIKETSTSRT